MRKNKGITLIALIITIIVLLILAGVTISTVIGENGVISKAIDSKEKQQKGDDKEKIELALGEYEINKVEDSELELDEFLESFDWCESVEITQKKIKIVMKNTNQYEVDLETNEIKEISAVEDDNNNNDEKEENISQATREDFFIIDQNGEVRIKRDTSENHDGIGFYYDGYGYKILSEENVVIPSYINGIEVERITGRAARSWDNDSFSYARNLKSIEMPSTMKYIGDYAFKECCNLETVILKEGIEEIGNYAFYHSALKTITIPSTVKNIGSYAFSGCDFTTMTIPSTLKSIGNNAFNNCCLETITIPSTLENIGHQAFSNCKNLETVILNEGLEEISGYAFSDCTSLTEVTIGSGIQSIYEDVFDGVDVHHSFLGPFK